MHLNVINHSVFGSVYFNSFFAINVFLVIFMSMLTKYKKQTLFIAVTIMIVFNIHAGYLFLSRDVMATENEIGFNSLTEFREHEEIYFYPGENIRLPKVQMALPGTRINVVADFTGVPEDEVLLASSHHLMREIFNHRINVDTSPAVKGVVQIHGHTIGGNQILLPVSVFNSTNGDIYENTITSNGDLGYLIYAPSVTLQAGTNIYSAQLELLNQNEAPDYVGHAELSFHNGASTFNHQPLYIGDFEDGTLTVFFEINIAEPMPSFEIRVLASEGAQLRVSNISVLFADPE